MAGKLWRYGKKLTLWGALVSSLPSLFILLMVMLVLGFAFAVPLGCAVGSYVCFRKLYGGLCRKRLIASGLKENEAAEAAELEISSIEVESCDENEESAEREFELEGHSPVQSEEVQSEAGEDLDRDDPRGEPETYEEEKPHRPYEETTYLVKPLEEKPHQQKLYEAETQSKWDTHALPSAGGGGQTSEDETHLRRKDEVQVSEEEAELTWDSHGEEQIHEDEAHSRLKDGVKAREEEPELTLDTQAVPMEKTAAEEVEQTPKDGIQFTLKGEVKAYEEEPELTLEPQAIPMETTAAEKENPKDEIEFTLKEEVKAYEGETPLTSLNHHAIVMEKVSPIATQDKKREEEEEEQEKEKEERFSKMQETPTNRTRHEQGAELILEKLSPIDTNHKRRDLEEKEEEESNEMQEIPSKRSDHEQGAELVSEKLSPVGINHERRDLEEKEEEESNEIQEISSKRSHHEPGAELVSEKLSSIDTNHKRRDLDREEEEESNGMHHHDQGVELDLEKLSPTDTTHKRREEDEEKEDSNEMQGVPFKRSSHEQGAEFNLEKFSPIDNKHKRREENKEEKEQESTEMGNFPFKRSRGEQGAELELAPSTPYNDNTIRHGNPAIPETTYYSAPQSVQAETPDRASFLGFEYDTASRDNDATELHTTTSLEVQISSGSESDLDSKCVSESTPERDSDDDATADDEKIWEEIHAVRKIVGYKEDPHPSYAEEIKELYVFTGVEPPASLKYSFDLIKAKEKLKFLKIVVGVK